MPERSRCGYFTAICTAVIIWITAILAIFLNQAVIAPKSDPPQVTHLDLGHGDSPVNHADVNAQASLQANRTHALTSRGLASGGHQVPPQALPLFTHTAEAILEMAKVDMSYNETSRYSLEEYSTSDKATFMPDVKPSDFAAVFEGQLMKQNMSEPNHAILVFYHHVSANETLRDASRIARVALTEASFKNIPNEKDFETIHNAYETRKNMNLTTEGTRMLEKIHTSFYTQGYLLPAGEKRDRFREIQTRINELTYEYHGHIQHEASHIWFTPEELEGLPAEEIDIDQLKKGDGIMKGKVMLNFKSHAEPFMKYVKDESARRRYAIANGNKAPDNVDIFRNIVLLSDEAARLLDYPNHAALRLQGNMAGKPAQVLEVIRTLRLFFSMTAKLEAKVLRDYKKRDCKKRGVPFDGKLYTWDVPFYSRLVKEKEHGVDDIAVSKYFPLDSTVSGTLNILGGTFGLVFIELSRDDLEMLSPTGKSEDVLWHHDVTVYSVWDDEKAGGAFRGYLYLDLRPRDGKVVRNFNMNLEPGFAIKEGGRHYPVNVVVCSIGSHKAFEPTVLKHADLRILFHELGHAIQALVTTNRYSGTRPVLEATEISSELMSNWCWNKKVLKSLSQHCETGAAMSDEMVEKLGKSKHFNEATSMESALHAAHFDLSVHTAGSHEALEAVKFGEMWTQTRKEITGINGPEDVGLGMLWGNEHASKSYFFSGWEAGLYRYIYSRAISKDIFQENFKNKPLNQKAGKKYRRAMMEPAGSTYESQMITDYMGRRITFMPLFERLTIAPPGVDAWIREKLLRFGWHLFGPLVLELEDSPGPQSI